MYTVEPIRHHADLSKFKFFLRQQSERNFILFMFGINTGLRISDILSLRISDIKNKTHIYLKEQKTGKERKIVISTALKTVLNNYIKGKDNNSYLFPSRNGINKPISRIQAWRILKNASTSLNSDIRVGTHTLRKTFGYHLYKKTLDVALLQNILNHSSPKITLRYIGINQEIIDNKLMSFSI